MSLLRDDEREVVEQVRSEAPPKKWGARLQYEFVRGCATVLVPRTIAIDDAIRGRPTEQLVILGAGLDSRAWRMPELATTTAFEVDHPATQADKRQRLGDRLPAAKEIRFVAIDFAAPEPDQTLDQALDQALEQARHRAGDATTWVWEGVVPYLTAAQVSATLAVVQARSAPGSRLVVNYQAPSAKADIGKLVGRLMMRLAGAADPWSDEPHRSHWTPDQFSALLDQHGFMTVRDQDLLQISSEMDLPRGAGDQGGSLANGHVLVADRR